jgi:mRNA interferase RelE/StbE
MYEVIISNIAKRQLDKIDPNIVRKITSKMLQLENEPRPTGCIKLKDKNGYRIRIGDYRILYEIDDSGKVVSVYKIAHRKEAYR